MRFLRQTLNTKTFSASKGNQRATGPAHKEKRGREARKTRKKDEAEHGRKAGHATNKAVVVDREFRLMALRFLTIFAKCLPPKLPG